MDYLLLYHFHFSPLKASYKKYINSVLKYIFHFLYYMTNIILVQIYESHIKISSFVEFFEKIIKSSYKLLKSPLSLEYWHQVWCTHLVKILKLKKLYSMSTILGTLISLCPISDL